MRIHSDQKQFQCPDCGRRFHQNGNLKNHMYTHTNLRPYRCKKCQRGFNQPSNLRSHQVKCNLKIKAEADSFGEQHSGWNFDGDGGQLEENNTSIQHMDESYFSDFKYSHEETLGYILSSAWETPYEIVVQPIETAEMKSAVENGNCPFAYVQFANGQQKLYQVLNGTILRHVNENDPSIPIIDRMELDSFSSLITVHIVAWFYEITLADDQTVFYMTRDNDEQMEHFHLFGLE